MLRLLNLRLLIAVLKRSLFVSGKLSLKTWIGLAVLHACLAIGSFWVYQAKSVPDSAIPPVYHAQLQPVPPPVDLSGYVARSWTPYAWGGSSNVTGYYWRTSPGFGSTTWTFPPSDENTGSHWGVTPIDRISSPQLAGMAILSPMNVAPGQSFTLSVSGQNFVAGRSVQVHLHFQANPFHPLVPELPDFGRTTVVQVSPSQEPSLFTSFERMIALLSTILNSLLTTFNLLMVWQVYKRAKLEAMLLQLQIEALTASNARLREEVEAMKREAQKSGIILLS